MRLSWVPHRQVTTGFSFFYADRVGFTGSVSVYSGPSGTGTLLASLTLPSTPDPYTMFVPVGVTFPGTADSVVFSGAANFIAFDNIPLGSSAPTVPEPASMALLGTGLIGLGLLRARPSAPPRFSTRAKSFPMSEPRGESLVDIFTPLGRQIRQSLADSKPPATNPAARARAAQALQRAVALRKMGRPAESVHALREAIAFSPQDGPLHYDLGLTLIQLGRFTEAVAPLQQAAALKPKYADAYYQLGIALQALGEDDPAMAAYRRAIAISPKLADAHNRLGCLLQLSARHEEAKTAFRDGQAAGRRSALGVVCEARRLALEENFPAARECLRQGLARFPDDLELTMLLGSILTFAGDLPGAAAQFEKSIALAPSGLTLPLVSLTQVRRMTDADQNLLERMRSLAAAPGLSDVSRMELHFALGKSCDDLGDYQSALRHYDAANEIRHRFTQFDRRVMRDLVDRVVEHCSGDSLRQRSEGACEDETPLLVLGMPRSGTTLVETILSSHPMIAGAGELTFWMDRSGMMDRGGPAALPRETLDAFATDYLNVLRGVSADALRVTDKMPFSFLWLGMIHPALPNARIIHCRRHPVDTCLSIYGTNFQMRRGFFSTRADLVFYYRQYERLMELWRRMLPSDRFTEVVYEDLIADRETETRRLVEFCGVPWDDACLAPEQNRRVVRTASMWQVRQPVYTSSVARWKRYENWLGEFAELLEHDPRLTP